jgi:hypothetical protein
MIAGIAQYFAIIGIRQSTPANLFGAGIKMSQFRQSLKLRF